MNREVIQMALDALEFFKGLSLSMKEIERAEEAITALQEALAEQPAQRCPLCNYQHGHAIGCKNNPVGIALNKMAENARELGLGYEAKSDHQLMENAQGDLERIKLVQIGVGISNPEQEPVAEVAQYDRIHWYDAGTHIPTGTKLYTHPPAREQEPVAYMSQDGDFYAPDEIVCVSKSKNLKALYPRPQALKPLTEKQRAKMYRDAQMRGESIMLRSDYEQGITDTEAAHGIKE